MSWFRVDDSFYDHPKVIDLPDCAVSLWARAGSWAARNLTDGFVPSSLPARLCGDPETAVRALVDHGLWKRTRGGHRFHDWPDFNPTKEKVQQRRDADRQRKRTERRRTRTPSSDTETSARTPNRLRTEPRGTPPRTPTGVTPESSRPDPESPSFGGGTRRAHAREARRPGPTVDEVLGPPRGPAAGAETRAAAMAQIRDSVTKRSPPGPATDQPRTALPVTKGDP